MATKPWSSTAPPGEFRPYVPPKRSCRNLRCARFWSASLAGLFFGAVTVYVGLRAGLTVSASIPISVLSISILRAFRQSQHPRKQHRADDGVGRRIDRRWRDFHSARADFSGLSARVLGRVFPGADWRMAGRAVHDSAAAPAHRQGARQPALSRGHGLRRRAGGGRPRRLVCQPRVLGSGAGRGLFAADEY